LFSQLLSISQLSHDYNRMTVLSDINLQIYENEIIGLIGTNGAGKTTLMSCIAGFTIPKQGIITLSPNKKLREVLFYLPDDVCLYPELQVKQVLALFSAAFKQQESLSEKIATELDLIPVYCKKVGSLSKGYRRRLLLSIALLSPQPLLLLDEPFDGLDLHQVHSVIKLLHNLRSQGRTLFLSIHQLNDAERICERFIFLSEGKLLAQGTLTKLREQTGLTENSNLEEIFLALI